MSIQIWLIIEIKGANEIGQKVKWKKGYFLYNPIGNLILDHMVNKLRGLYESEKI